MRFLAFMFAVAAAGGVQAGDDGDILIARSLEQLHAEQFDAALMTARALQQLRPQDAAGYLAAANIYQTMMRDYRVRAYEEPFLSSLRQARALADRNVDASPSARAFLARGASRAYQAIHRFSSGDWARAILDAVHGVHDAERALRLDPSFADAVLAVAVHDFWKAEKLGLGLGFFGGGRRTVVSRLEWVRREGRFLSVEAGYALQTVHFRQGDLHSALAANEWLQRRFPENPVGLYHRGLILEGLGRDGEALEAWEKLLGRLQAFPHASDGFLAECHLHRARLLGRSGPASAAHARAAAARHAAARVAERELEGPLVPFAEVRRAIARLGEPAPTAPAAR